MRSSEAPSGWHPDWPPRRQAKPLVAGLYLGLVAVVCPVLGVLAAGEGDWVEAAFFAWAFVFMASLAVQGLLGSRSFVGCSPRVAVRRLHAHDSNALVIPGRAAALGVWLVLVVLLVPLATALTVGASVSLAETFDVVAAAVLVASLAVLVFCVGVLVDVVRGRVVAGHLALSPHGILYRAPGMIADVPWTDLRAVTAWPSTRPSIALVAVQRDQPRRTSFWWRAPELKAAPLVVVTATGLAIDPWLLYRTLRFYADNAAARAELATEAALVRVRSGDVTESVARTASAD